MYHKKKMEKLLIAALLFLASLSTIASAQDSGQQYEVVDGTVRFECWGQEIKMPAWGRFAAVDSKVLLNPASLSSASGNVKIDLVTVFTEDAAWDAMFRASTFLEIDQYPHSEFIVKKMTGAESLPNGEWVPVQLHGVFSLHGVTKDIVVPATTKWIASDPSTKPMEQLFVRAFFNIKWKDYKIDVPQGRTRTFAGDGANIQVQLKYQPKQASSKKKSRSKS